MIFDPGSFLKGEHFKKHLKNTITGKRFNFEKHNRDHYVTSRIIQGSQLFASVEALAHT